MPPSRIEQGAYQVSDAVIFSEVSASSTEELSLFGETVRIGRILERLKRRKSAAAFAAFGRKLPT